MSWDRFSEALRRLTVLAQLQARTDLNPLISSPTVIDATEVMREALRDANYSDANWHQRLAYLWTGGAINSAMERHKLVAAFGEDGRILVVGASVGVFEITYTPEEISAFEAAAAILTVPPADRETPREEPDTSVLDLNVTDGRPIIRGEKLAEEHKLTRERMAILRALWSAGPTGMSGPELQASYEFILNKGPSNGSRADRVLKGLGDIPLISDLIDWEREKGSGYRLHKWVFNS